MASATPTAARFKAYVDGQMAGSNYWGYEDWHAALMSKVTGNASYCTYAVSKADAYVTSEEARIAAGSAPVVAGDSYLEVGPRIGSLMTVYDWCRTQTTAAQRTRWMNLSNQAVWNVWNPNQANWGGKVMTWSGWSVNDPSNNYYYSFLKATMFTGLATYGENPQAQGWITQFRTSKIANQLVPTFKADLSGGGSREGTGYGLSHRDLFRLYDWWQKSTTERIADLTPHAQESLHWMMHQIAPSLDRLAPTGDHARDSAAMFYDYHRDYLQVAAYLYPNDLASGVAKTLLSQSNVTSMTNGFNRYADFLYDTAPIAAQPLSTLATVYRGAGTGLTAMRSSWDKDATYANLICGPYTQSHAHQDQGSFTLFNKGWLAIDENINTHSGIEQAVGLHNLVRVDINGSTVSQAYNTTCNLAALGNNANYTYALAKTTPNYAGKSGVAKVEREFLFIKPSTVVVFDRVQSNVAGAKRVWAMNLATAPTVNGDSFNFSNGSSTMNVTRLSPTGLSAQVLSWPTLNSQANSGVRVDVADSTGDSSMFLNVIGVNSSVKSSVRSDATGQTGGQISLADGRTVTVRFNNTGTGGNIIITNSAGAQLVNEALPTVVQNLPRTTTAGTLKTTSTTRK